MKTINSFSIGDRVDVNAEPDDLFLHNFTGTVIGFKDNFVQVKDQDDDVWDCEPDQLTLNSDTSVV